MRHVHGWWSHREGLLLTLTDRVIRVAVTGQRGRPLPATVRVYVDGQLLTTAATTGKILTVQIGDRQALVKLEADAPGQQVQAVSLASDQDSWDFKFADAEVPVDGERPFWQEHISGILGVFFLLLTIVLAAVFGTPTAFQRRVFVGTLAIALAGIAAEVPGMINVKLTLGEKLAITAAGAMGIFVIVYFFVPP
jgi:hypothetical protein